MTYAKQELGPSIFVPSVISDLTIPQIFRFSSTGVYLLGREA